MTDYLKILDDILDYFYERIGDEIMPSNIQSQFKIDKHLFYACIEKIHRSSHIDKLNNERAERAICKINLDGILFKESGGYRQRQSDINNERTKIVNQNFKNNIVNTLLVIGSILAGIGTIALVTWEIYKHYYLHTD